MRGGEIHYVVRFTRTGRYLHALRSNADAARRQGIPVLRITHTAHVLSSVAALAGILLVSRLGVASPLMANACELPAIAAAVVGGASLFGGRGTMVARSPAPCSLLRWAMVPSVPGDGGRRNSSSRWCSISTICRSGSQGL